MKTLIKNAQIVNEGKIFKADVLIENDLIAKISENISQSLASNQVYKVNSGSGKSASNRLKKLIELGAKLFKDAD